MFESLKPVDTIGLFTEFTTDRSQAGNFCLVFSLDWCSETQGNFEGKVISHSRLVCGKNNLNPRISARGDERKNATFCLAVVHRTDTK
jgi:hypothetical protein